MTGTLMRYSNLIKICGMKNLCKNLTQRISELSSKKIFFVSLRIVACVRGPRICQVDELTEDRRRATYGLQTDVGGDLRVRENESAFSLQTFSCYLLDATDVDSYFLQFPSKEKEWLHHISLLQSG